MGQIQHGQQLSFDGLRFNGDGRETLHARKTGLPESGMLVSIPTRRLALDCPGWTRVTSGANVAPERQCSGNFRGFQGKNFRRERCGALEPGLAACEFLHCAIHLKPKRRI